MNNSQENVPVPGFPRDLKSPRQCDWNKRRPQDWPKVRNRSSTRVRVECCIWANAAGLSVVGARLLSMRLMYVLAEHPATLGRRTLFHLLSEGDISLLRCLMTLLLLPADTSAMMVPQFPFLAALSRLSRLPTMRKINAALRPPNQMWQDMVSEQLLILMLGGAIPDWFAELAAQRPVAVLSQSTETTEQLAELPGVFSGLLKGMDDLREAYKAIGQLAGAISAAEGHDSDTRSVCRDLAATDLFRDRPRLGFIPPLPLPEPNEGRPAVYLLNRLSNNVDEPAVWGGRNAQGLGEFPTLLDSAIRASSALSIVELGEQPPATLSVGVPELQQYHDMLVATSESNEKKLAAFLELGRRIGGGRFPPRALFAIPSPRPDLVRGKVPKSVSLDPGHKEAAKAAVRAVTDELEGKLRTEFGTKKDEQAYLGARETLTTEQRIISCQSAFLAGAFPSVPVQLSLLSGDLYNCLFDLSAAFAAGSRKIPKIFGDVQARLAAALPAGITEHWVEGQGVLTLFTDLPFEWTSARGWPICLHRPVSRIPIGLNDWDILMAAMSRQAVIDIDHPERVLVFDLVERHDPIREHSDMFIGISRSLGQKYRRSKPNSAEEFRRTLVETEPEIVVLDTHGSYDKGTDELAIRIGGTFVPVSKVIPDALVPPIWILSACQTSVVGAMRGCLVRKLFSRGALCVVATLARVDAFTASMFVGRLLTDVYNPKQRGMYNSFAEPFFQTQLTTALLYDQMLPLLRRGQKDQSIAKRVGEVFLGYLAWAGSANVTVPEFRDRSRQLLWELLENAGLAEQQRQLEQAGLVLPETMLFTMFGAPEHISLRHSGEGSERRHSDSHETP